MPDFTSRLFVAVSVCLLLVASSSSAVGAPTTVGVGSSESAITPEIRSPVPVDAQSRGDTNTTVQSNTTLRTPTQSPVEVWNRTYAGDGTTVVTDLVATADGGYLLTGVTGFNSQNADAWVLKLHGDGTRAWSRTYDATSIDVIRDVIETADGYLLAGATNVSLSTSEAWLLKISKTGRDQWDRRYGTNPFTVATGVVQTPAGGYAFVGVTGNVVTGNTSAWLVATTDRGRVQWRKRYAADSATDLVRGHDTAYVLAGTTNSRADGWAAGVGARGTTLWTREYGSEIDRLNVIQRTENGYLLGGVAGLESSRDGDGWLVSTDSDGQRRWTKTYGDRGLDSIVSVVPAQRGYLFSGVRGEGETNGISWGVAVGDRGTVQWTDTFGRSGFSVDGLIVQPTAVVAGHDGGYLFASVTAGGAVRVVRLVPGKAVFDRPLAGLDDNDVPTDPDGDGLFEDVNGDATVTFADAIALAFADTTGLSPAQLAALDLDDDGDLDFDDAVELAFQTGTAESDARLSD